MQQFLFLLMIVIPLGSLIQAVTPVEAAEYSYVGNKKCKMCHLKEWQSWSETKMGKSYELLKKGVEAESKKKAKLDPSKDYTKDPMCLPCHTTGYGKPGGFVDMKATPDLVGVGCEMCHGPGGTYTQPEHMSFKNKEYKKSEVVRVGLIEKITQAQCTVCHNSKSPFVGKDYVFDFEAKKKKGIHAILPLQYKH